jgi:hypothetical protein
LPSGVPCIVGEVVGNIVGVSETARVGVGGSGVMVYWFVVIFSLVPRGGVKKLPFSLEIFGKLLLACKSGQAIKLKIRTFIVSSRTKLSGLIRILRFLLFLRFGERLVFSDTSDLEVMRTFYKWKIDHCQM